MEKEVNEYIEGQPKKKRTEAEYIVWLQELADRAENDTKKIDALNEKLVKLLGQLKREHPEVDI
jgi:hypothetical protein